MAEVRTMRRHARGALLAAILAGLAPWALAAERSCPPTRPDTQGPYYRPNAPARTVTGRGLVVQGVVRSHPDCKPVPGAMIEWWAADGAGVYDDLHRATLQADPEGRYRYETDFPGRYAGRPPHLHLRVTAAGLRTLVTQIYPAPGQTSLVVDLVLLPE